VNELPDLYPSRIGGEARILPRKDPVVHGTRRPADGPLSSSEIEQFERSGFLALEGVLDDHETAELRDEAAALRQRRAGSEAPEVIVEHGSGEIRSVFAIHRSSPRFATLARHPQLLGAVKQILGESVYLHQSRINYKPAFCGREFYWHSDFETWHVEDGMPRMSAVSASVNLLENNPHNGPLMLIPGSHRQFVSCAGVTPERHYEESLKSQKYGVPEPAIVETLVQQGGLEAPAGPPGSIVLFDCNVLHGSNGNITPWPRSNAFFVFNALDNTLVAPFSGQAPRPEYIASREHVEPLEIGEPR